MTRALLWAASWIVPRERRRAWLDEWRAELWHVRTVDRARAFRFSCGAFRDAGWLRRHERSPRMSLLASPVHCLALLAILAGAAFALRPVERLSEELVAIRPHGARLTVTFDQYRAFAEHLPHGFMAVAFYRILKDGAAIATPSAGDVLRGSSLPGALRFRTAKDPGPGPGYMIARVSIRPAEPPWHIQIPSENGHLLFDCGPIAPRMPFMPFLVILVAALVVAAGTTSFSLGDMPRRAWLFLGVKGSLALTAAWFGAQCLPLPVVPQALIVSFALALRWSLHDQRRRCPVCLRRVTNPVSFGCLSHTLLDWHGSEFVCPEGHGLMQISATVASPYAAQQWVRL
jgi:hypothetical protein